MDFERLNSKFHKKLYAFIDRCKEQDIALDFDIGFVSLEDQARAWKRSRSDAEIDSQIAELRADGAPFLAELLMESKASTGAWKTDQLPGFSWHNWGQAYTFCVLGEDGKPVLESSKIYAKVAELAKDAGIASGYNLKPRIPGLVQLSLHKFPANTYSPKEISKEMESMYGNN